MRVLDLYCCSGGAGWGYKLAGATLVRGVDVVQRDYRGDEFRRRDAIGYLTSLDRAGLLRGRFDLIHASPPCQAASTLTVGTNASRGWGGEHRQWVPETRAALDETGIPYVIEQPAGHKGLIRADLRLCMDMFPLDEPPWVQRHRDFEISGFTVPQPKHGKHRGYVRGYRHGVYRDGPYVAAYGSGGGKATIAEMQHALEIPWTSEREELTEAIPPAYTKYIGLAFLGREDGCE
jgi:hypothetical protein